MHHRHTIAVLGALFTTIAGTATTTAQEAPVDTIPWIPHNQLTITAPVRLDSMRGDTIRLTYSVRSEPTSVQSGIGVVLTRTAEVWVVGSPRRWAGHTTMVQDSAGIFWLTLASGDRLDPGESLTGFSIAGVGATDLVTLRVVGDVPAPIGNESDNVEYAPPPPIWIDAAEATTVGIGPQRTGSAAVLLDRLLALSSRACELTWVSSASACSLLNARLSAARAALARGDRDAARTEIDGYVADLEARRGAQVTESAHALLWPNAKTLREKI